MILSLKLWSLCELQVDGVGTKFTVDYPVGVHGELQEEPTSFPVGTCCQHVCPFLFC